MRLFVALDVPDQVRGEVTAGVDPVRANAPAALRWSDPVRWHLTLAFLGDVADARVDALVARLRRAAARHDPPTLQVSGAGRFDGRVLWAGVHEAPSSVGRLRPLAASVAGAARHTGIDVEDRPYRAHLTLARCSTPTDLRSLVDALSSLRSREWTPAHVRLVHSRLGPSPEHTVLESLSFRTAPLLGVARPTTEGTAPPRTDPAT